MQRKIYNKLIEWKHDKNQKPLMVLGVRQCGKTYIIDDFCKNEFENYVYLNLLESENIVELYDSSMSSDEKFKHLKAFLNFDIEKENTILFIDEIQESGKLISELKYFCERHNNIRIICAGSLLGVKLKRSKISFPVGKVKMLYMYPMDFEEFLMAMNENMLIDLIRECYDGSKQIGKLLHEKSLNLYKTYLITGGMPESILDMVQKKGDYVNYDTTILADILNSYFNDMNKYVADNSEAIKIKQVYDSLPPQLSNPSNKFQFSKVDKNARSREYATTIDWLEASNMVIKCNLVKLPEIPLEGFKDPEAFKLYLSDVGILNSVIKISINDILSDNISLYKGVIAENYVANQLISLGYDLYYWQSDNTAEIDFLLYTKDGVIPLEVKAGDTTKSKSLKVYNEKYNPLYSIRISTKDFGYDPTLKIKSIPLYAVFCLAKEK